MADQSFKIEIQTKADLRALENTKAALERAIAAARAAGKDTSSLETQLANVTQTLASGSTRTDAAAQSTRKLTSAKTGLKDVVGELTRRVPLLGQVLNFLTNPLGALVAGFTGLVAAMRSFLSEAAKQEVATARLHQAMAQVGVLTGQSKRQYAELAGELQRTTGVADDEWLAALRTLTQFGSTPQSVGMDVEAVKNLAGLLDGDLRQAALLWGRALQGNFEMFTRYGLKVRENASDSERLLDIYEQLAIRGGGQLESMTKTMTGRWTTLKNATGDLAEEVGFLLDRAADLRGGVGLLATAAEVWGGWTAKLTDLLGGKRDAVEGLTNSQGRHLATQEALARQEQQLAESVKAAKTALDEKARALDKLLALEERQRRLQDELADTDMAIALERLRAMNLAEPTRLQAEKAIRDHFTRDRTERQAGGLEDEAQKREQGIRTRERDAAAAASDAINQRRRADEISAFERQQANVAEREKKLNEGVAYLESLETSPLSTASQAEADKIAQGLEMDVEALAKEREKLAGMRQGLEFGGLDEQGRLRPKRAVETGDEADARAAEAEARARTLREESDKLNQAEREKIEAARAEAKAIRTKSARQQELEDLRTANDVREAQRRPVVDTKGGLTQGRTPAVSANHAAALALGGMPVQPPRGPAGVPEPPITGAPRPEALADLQGQRRQISQTGAELSQALQGLGLTYAGSIGQLLIVVREQASQLHMQQREIAAVRHEVKLINSRAAHNRMGF
jgi:hypothetical protein